MWGLDRNVDECGEKDGVADEYREDGAAEAHVRKIMEESWPYIDFQIIHSCYCRLSRLRGIGLCSLNCSKSQGERPHLEQGSKHRGENITPDC